MDWLSLKAISDPRLPFDRMQRSVADLRGFKDAFSKLNADIYGLQEVDGLEAIQDLLPSHAYKIYVSPTPIAQRVVIAVRRSLNVTVQPPVSKLDVSLHEHHHLREGLDVIIDDGEIHLRILVVHLKTGCWENVSTSKSAPCRLFYRQIAILSDWIAQRRRDQTPFLILGDFNRRFTESDPAFERLRGRGALQLATSGLASPCQGGTYFIDHMISGGAKNLDFIPGSLRVMTSAAGQNGRALSDHCPLSVTLHVPP